MRVPGRTRTPIQLVVFMTKQKPLRKSLRGLLFTAKILQDAMYITITAPNSLLKFNPKMHDLKRVLDLNCHLKKDRTIYFFSVGFQTLKM